MAYSVIKKVMTNHSLMDEIVYNGKIILRDIILKNNKLAAEYETEQSVEEADYFLAIKNGNMELSFFPLTLEMLTSYGYNALQARSFIYDRNMIPYEDRDSLLAFCNQYYLDHYEEKNDYYRMLNGLPEYGTDVYNVYIDPYHPKLSVSGIETDFNFSAPLHMYSNEQLNTLDSLGILDEVMNTYTGKHYRYLKYIGSKKIDYYTSRNADEWSIIYMPTVETMVGNRFKELYKVNRDIYYRRTYQQAYSFESDYYEEMMMLCIVCQTFTDLIVDIPEWYIRRDIFDIRTCQYFLDSQGVKFFKEIPLKYQIRIVKNLNRLIQYKSTNKNINDILEIFSTEGTQVFRYHLLKRRKGSIYKKDESGNLVQTNPPPDAFVDDNGNIYELEFVKVPINDNYDNYIKDQRYRLDYDLITLNDPYWDGEDTHEYVKENHLKKDFTIEPTKYLSLDYEIYMSDYSYQISYFLGLIFQSEIDINNINISIPVIKSGQQFSLKNIFMLLVCLDGLYDDQRIKIQLPNELRRFPKQDYYDQQAGIEYIVPPDTGDWYLDDLDFGYDDDGAIVHDKYSEDFDFGYHNTIIPTEVVHDYDYGMEVEGNTTEDVRWRLKDIDFGDNDLENIVHDRYSKNYDFGSEVIIDYAKPYQDHNFGDMDNIIDLGPDDGVYTTDVTPRETYYDWLAWRHPYMWVDITGRVLGFNLNIDLKEFESKLNVRHSSFGFSRGFTLKDIGCDTFITANKISSVEELLKIYQTNTKCYFKLKELLESASTRDERRVYQYAMDTLFTRAFPYELYKLNSGQYAVNYDEILAERDYTLYEFYLKLAKEENTDIRRDNIRTIISDIADTLEYYFSGDYMQYVFSFVASHSFDSVLTYINLMINFFKSWKSHFVEPTITYILDSPLENSISSTDQIVDIKEKSLIGENIGAVDIIDIKEYIYREDIVKTDVEEVEITEKYVAQASAPLYDGGTARDMSDTSINSNYTSIAEDFKIVNGYYKMDGGSPSSRVPYLHVNGGGV